MSVQFPSALIMSGVTHQPSTPSFHASATADTPLSQSSISSLSFSIFSPQQTEVAPLTGRVSPPFALSVRRKLLTPPSAIQTLKPKKMKSPFIQKAESILDTKTITRGDRTVKLVPFSEGHFSEIFKVEGETPLIADRSNEQIVIRIYKKEHLQYSNAKIEGFLDAQLNNYYELSLLQIPTPYIYNLSTYQEDGYFIVYFIPDPFPFPQKGASAKETKKVKKDFIVFQEQIREILATCYAYGVTADAKADNFRVGWTQDLRPVATLCDWMEYAEDFASHLAKPVLPSFDFIKDPTLDPRILPYQTFNQIPELEALTTQTVDSFLGETPSFFPLLKLEEEKEWEPVKPLSKGIAQLKEQMIEQVKSSGNLEKSFIDAVEELQKEAGLQDISLLTLRNLKRFQKELALAFRSMDLEDLQSSLENLKVYLTDTEVRSLWDLFSHEIDSLDQKEKLFEKIVEFLSPQNESIRLYLAGKR